MFLSSKIIHWDLIPTVLVLGGGAVGSWSGHESGACMKEISALMKGPTRLPHRFPTWGHRNPALTRHWICQHIHFGLPSLQNHERQICAIYKPSRLWSPVRATWMDTTLETNTGCDRENFQTASLCWTPRLLQVRTFLLFTSQPCFLLPPHLCFYSAKDWVLFSASTHPPSLQAPGYFPSNPGHREISNFSESL